MPLAFDTKKRQKLMNELNTSLDENECRIARILLSNTTINIQFEDCKREEIETSIRSPQGDGTIGTFFNIVFEKSLRKLREKMNKMRPEIEHYYVETTNPPKELIFADESDLLTFSKTERELLKGIMKETLVEENLIVNEDKTEEIIINRLKDKNDEEWRKTKN